MFELSGVRAFGIAEWWICLNDAAGDEVIQLYAYFSCESKVLWTGRLTPSRYLSCPKRSRYLRQNGRVPKFLLMVFRRPLADVTRKATFGASALFA